MHRLDDNKNHITYEENSAVSNFVTSNEITSNRYFLSNYNGN